MNTLAFVSDPAAAGSMITTFITFGLIILIFYFLIIRPQKKRDKEAQAMIEALKKGDKVVTIGGIHGTIITVKEHTVVIKVDDNARIEFSKSAVSSVLNKEKAPAPKKEKEKKAVEAPAAPAAPAEAPAEEKTENK